MPKRDLERNANLEQAPACVHTEISVFDGSFLIMQSAPLICFENTELEAKTTLHVQIGSRAIFSDILAKRQSSNHDGYKTEPSYIFLNVHIYYDNQLQFTDTVEISQNPLFDNDDLWNKVTDESCIGAAYFVGTWEPLATLREIVDRYSKHVSDLSVAISATTDNVITMRVCATRAQDISDLFSNVFRELITLHQKDCSQLPSELGAKTAIY